MLTITTEVRVFWDSQMWEATMTKRIKMKTDPYCQRQNCSRRDVYDCIDYVDIAVRSTFSGLSEHSGRKWRFSSSVGLYENISQTVVINSATITITVNRKLHIADSLWSSLLGALRYCQVLRAYVGYLCVS